MIVACQPNITIGDDKQTVYAQQKRYLKYILKSPLCPREAFKQDLTTEIYKWTEKGDLVMLFLDANDDLWDSDTHTWLTNTLRLKNCLHDQHSNLPPPSAYTRNFKSKPIDGCYASPTLQIEKCGFLLFREGIGDHRIVYIDVDETKWLEGDVFKIKPPQIRRLQCGDVRIVRTYLNKLRKLLNTRSISERVEKLYDEQHQPFTPAQIQEYERIDSFITEYCLTAEKRCRKVRVGNIPFSPIVDTAAKTSYLWSLILSKMRGTKVSTSLIRR